MNRPLISIIIPVYNSELYLEECLKSVVSQTYQNIEIIIVDDGSTDNSALICKKYAETDRRIKFYQQKNKGVAETRRMAVYHAKGNYIGFVDSDDRIENRLFEQLISNIQNHDLVTSGYYRDFNKEIKILDSIEPGVYETKEQLVYLINNMILAQNENKMGIIRSLSAKLFQKRLVNEVLEEINPNIFMGEDGEFLYKYILKCSSIVVTNICGYFYRMREGSAVHSINKRYLRNIDELYNSLESLFIKHPQHEVLIFQLERWMNEMLNASTYYLGFGAKTQKISYIFPMVRTIVGKKIILYGAGQVGQSYKLFFERTNICEIILWVDKEWKRYSENGKDVSSIENIGKKDYDYIIIGVKNESLAENIKKQLWELGILKSKILWEKPVI